MRCCPGRHQYADTKGDGPQSRCGTFRSRLDSDRFVHVESIVARLDARPGALDPATGPRRILRSASAPNGPPTDSISAANGMDIWKAHTRSPVRPTPRARHAHRTKNVQTCALTLDQSYALNALEPSSRLS